jgi:lipid II:glycine glycyltransferase (peptidoglycan interpeptide bridge formation enzyme)
MKVVAIDNQTVWNQFIDENDSSTFLQTWEWGELQEKLGYDIYRLGVYDNDILTAIALTLKVDSKRGSFLFIPHGPLLKKELKNHTKPIIQSLSLNLIEIGKKERCSFVRISPILVDNPQNAVIFKEIGFRKSPIYMHAERVWVLPLVEEEEVLMEQMRKTTRYLIRKAPKDRVVIEKRTDEEAVDDFWQIYEKTAQRERFVPFSKKYITEEFHAFHKTGNALFLFGRVDNDCLAAALIIFTKSSAFYHQGASIHSKFPVTYFLQWEAIKEAKHRGCLLYNFWGILQEGRTPKSWQGLSLFKKGFGGHQIDYLPTQDLVLSPKYYLTWLYENYLRLKRGI